MGINVYNSNSEEKYSKIIAMLKNLPEEKAPEDFEFRLMTKIENGNFELSGGNAKQSFPVWVFAPALAIVFSAVVFFIVFDSMQFTNSGSLFPEPKLREEVTAKNLGEPKEFLSKSSSAIEKSNTIKVIVEPNDVVVTQRLTPPKFSTVKTVNVDQYIAKGGVKGKSTITGPKVLVGGSKDPYFEFDGFYIVKENRDSLQKMKSKIDSMKRANKRNGRLN